MEFKWDMCKMCGPMIICPKCGNNCCNGMYGEIDGKECDVCPEAYKYQWENNPPKELIEKFEKFKKENPNYDYLDKFFKDIEEEQK